MKKRFVVLASGVLAVGALTVATVPAMGVQAAPPASVASAGDNFAYAVNIQLRNHTDRVITYYDSQTGTVKTVQPGQAVFVSGGKLAGVDIDSWFSFDGEKGQRYSLRAKNPSFSTPWIDVAGTGERTMKEGDRFTHSYDGHTLRADRGNDSAQQNGYKHFGVDFDS